jgi:hypothetical protein
VEEKRTGEEEPGAGCRRSEYRRILTRGETGMTNEVIVVEYDPRWPSLFEEEKARLLVGAGDQIEDIQHIGNPAVPGPGPSRSPHYFVHLPATVSPPAQVGVEELLS